jgi:hypothetical protein
MVENAVWTPVPKSEVGRCKSVDLYLDHEGTFRARLNGRGFEQVPGIHYDPKSLAAPVVSLMTIRIVFVLMIMANWTAHVLDVRGAFLKGDFGDGETYLHVPQGMTKWYSGNVVLLLKKTLYGLKQAAYRFWSYLLTIVHHVQFSRSKADPCLYFRWTESGALLLWFSWVDDCIVTGSEEEMLQAKHEIMFHVDCEDGGEMKEFVGCKIDHDNPGNSS